MYHILAAKRHRQDGAFLGKLKTLAVAVRKNFGIAPDAPGLVELPAAVLACVRGVNEQVHVAAPGGGFHSVRTVDEVARARFHAEAVQSRLTKGRSDLVA